MAYILLHGSPASPSSPPPSLASPASHSHPDKIVEGQGTVRSMGKRHFIQVQYLSRKSHAWDMDIRIWIYDMDMDMASDVDIS